MYDNFLCNEWGILYTGVENNSGKNKQAVRL